MKTIPALILSLFLFLSSEAQRRQDSWQEHLSFVNAKKVVVGGDKVYVATEGGLFYYSLSDNSLSKITRINGLNDFGIRTIGWSDKHQTLLIAYNNSNIDLLKDNTVMNLPDIYRKQMTGDMNIYNITFNEDDALLSCGFGIVSVNLLRREIRDTWYIGIGGDAIRVNDVEVFESYIYAATDIGLLRAETDNSNIADYRNWERVTAIPNNSRKFSHLMVHGSSLIANYTPDEYSQDAMYRLRNTEWESYIPQISYIQDARVSGNYLLIASRTRVYVVDENDVIIGNINSYAFPGGEATVIAPSSVEINADGIIWIADNAYGLVRIGSGVVESFFPPGPSDNDVFSLHSTNGDLWILPGGRTDSWANSWERPRLQLLRNSSWDTLDSTRISGLVGFFDIVDMVTHPSNPNHLFAASWGGGLLEIVDGQLVNRYTNHNSPLQTALPHRPEEPYVRIGGLAFDSEGNLWVTNSDVDNNLFKLTPDRKWESFSMSSVKENNIGKVIVTQNDDKWVQVPRGNDVYVVNKDGTVRKQLLVTSYFNNGQQEILNRMNDVYTLVEDLDGAIWIGTSKGVAVYNNPRGIWNQEAIYAIQPSLDLKDGLYHPLLETETVTAIAVDGANRKWIGTRNSGVYLVSEMGDKEVLHFTTDNSPLLSNSITAITINQKSGEVFIGTGAGLISYQGDAVSGNDTYAEVYVYPNPVRETWDGDVTIMGLVEETDIKITDISGNLVHQGKSLGGQAVWNGKNLNGRRVKTGVYLIFCTDRFGEKTHIEKLLFIN